MDAESGLVHTVEATAANVHDIVKADALLHGKETVVYGDAGYLGVDKCDEMKAIRSSGRWRQNAERSKRCEKVLYGLGDRAR